MLSVGEVEKRKGWVGGGERSIIGKEPEMHSDPSFPQV